MSPYCNKLLTTILLLLAVIKVSGQEADYFTYTHIGQAEGMHSQRIYSVLQTSDGALWWSSKNDVERYNGVNIKHYQLGNPAIYSDFAGKRITLCQHHDKEVKAQDPSNILAFDDKGHIYGFDPAHDKFIIKADISSLSIDLNDILQTDNGYWVATNKGIFFYALKDQSIIKVVKEFWNTPKASCQTPRKTPVCAK